mmetsp:Transcript_6869/g.16840  ORF Transcript_6869/g.16840 Transcript_6869/m.16840 type:complete len:217 (+) Transcript_6869:60-710(+)
MVLALSLTKSMSPAIESCVSCSSRSSSSLDTTFFGAGWCWYRRSKKRRMDRRFEASVLTRLPTNACVRSAFTDRAMLSLGLLWHSSSILWQRANRVSLSFRAATIFSKTSPPKRKSSIRPSEASHVIRASSAFCCHSRFRRRVRKSLGASFFHRPCLHLRPDDGMLNRRGRTVASHGSPVKAKLHRHGRRPCDAAISKLDLSTCPMFEMSSSMVSF